MAVITQNTQPHARILVRKALQALLRVSVDLHADKFFMSRPNPLLLREVPCCALYFEEDSADHGDRKPREYLRELKIAIHFIVRWEDYTLVEDWLDSREFEVIQAIENNRFLGLEFVEDSWLTGSVPVSITDEGNENVESTKVMWTFKYRDCLNYLVDESNIGDFITLNVKYKNIDDPNIILAEDLKTIQ